MLTETRTIAGQVYVVGYQYAHADLVSQTTYPSGRIVTYIRDAQGRVTTTTTFGLSVQNKTASRNQSV